MRLNFLSFGCCLVASQLFAQAALADTVYSWTDAEGVTHFSDNPPARSAAGPPPEVETMPMPAGFAEAAAPREDYYSITNQWQRLQEERSRQEQLSLQREQVRIDHYRARQEGRRAAAANRATEPSSSYILPYAGQPAFRPHASRHFRRGLSFQFRRSLGHRGGHRFQFRGRFSPRHGHRDQPPRRSRQQQHFVGNQPSPETSQRLGGGSASRSGFSLGLNRD